MWRDCSAWLKNDNIKMNTTSNEACKLYDCALTQVVKWRELDEYGGLCSTLNKMLEADSDFFLGHILKSGLELIGSSATPSPILLHNLNSLKVRQEKMLTNHELLHYDAIVDVFHGRLRNACRTYEQILVDKPFDMLALRFVNNLYFYTGDQLQLRDSIARVIPQWSKSKPLYSYLLGMHSFGLVETNLFEDAKKTALQSLEMDGEDAYAAHTICHYNEYRGEPEAGLKFLHETESDWAKCNLFAFHNYWHMCVHHVERGEHGAALHIFDTILSQRIESHVPLDFIDMVSLLYRLELDLTEFDLSERWYKLQRAYKSRVTDHGYLFNDMHVAMLIGNRSTFTAPSSDYDSELKSKFIDSFGEYLTATTAADSTDSNLLNTNRDLGARVFNAVLSFQESDYERVVDELYPARYELIRMGGSNAQRDVLNQMLLQAALRSTSRFHNKIGLGLMNERGALKPNSGLTERLRARFASQHIHNN
jgi:hypothetical protein